MTATVNDPNYQGSASNTFTIHAPPVAGLRASASEGNPPLEVVFTDASSGNISAWYLETFDTAGRVFENRGAPARALYDKPGVYEALLTVRGPGGQSQARVQITVHSPPQVGQIAPASVREDQVLELNLAGLDSRPGTWSVQGTDPKLVARTEVQGDLIRFTPVANAAGTNVVEIVRTGTSGLSAGQRVEVKWLAEDDPPGIDPSLPAAYQAEEDMAIQAGGAGLARDADTDATTLVWSAAEYDPLLVATAEGSGGGVRFVPVANAHGQSRAVLKLRDPATGAEASREIALSWTPVNDPPRAPAALFPADGAAEVALAPALSWTAQDADGDPLRYALYLAPASEPLALIAADLGEGVYRLPLLKPNTAYAWKVVVQDPQGASAEASFAFTTQADRLPPAIGNVRVAAADRRAAVSWNTSEPTRGSVRAAPERAAKVAQAGSGLVEVLAEELAEEHQVVLEGLESATWYHYEVGATDEAGNAAAVWQGRFLTLATADQAPPQILAGPFAEGLTPQSAVIRWTTDELSDSRVRYAEKKAAPKAAQGEQGGGEVFLEELVEDHRVRLAGLTAGTTYIFEVESMDASGNRSAARAGNFATARSQDTSPPGFVEGPVVRSIADVSALVELKSDELTRAQVRFDRDEDLGDGRLASSQQPAAAHQLLLDGLAAGVQYYYQALIADESGNERLSSVRSFKTRAAPDTRAARILAGPAIDGVTDAGAVLVLGADEPVRVQVLLAANEQLEQPVLKEHGGLQVNLSLALTNLQADTEYFYEVRVFDGAGNLTPPVKGRFRTAQSRDASPPDFVEAPFLEDSGASEATVVWSTSEPATGVVRYGLTPTMDQGQILLSELSQAQRAVLAQLEANTTYYLEVVAQDAQGNQSAPAQESFKTRQRADQEAPLVVSGPSTQGITASSALVEVSYDEPVDLVLRYGTAADLEGAEEVAGSGRQREQRWELLGLEAGTTYYAGLEARDAAGNTAEEKVFSFTTAEDQDQLLPVFLVGPAALSITHQSARIEWGLDEPGDGEVELSTREDLSEARVIRVLARRRQHAVELAKLAPNTTYFYQVRSTDLSGNTATSAILSFRTLGEERRGPPEVTVGPVAQQVGQDQASLFWRTDQPADSRVEYYRAATPEEALAENQGRLETEHQVFLTRLAPAAEYHYAVRSRNAQGVDSEVRRGSFRTRAQADREPPVILGLPTVVDVEQDRARIGWNTDEVADSEVEFWIAGGEVRRNADPAPVVAHLVDLANLVPGTTYQWRVRSTDREGNTSAWSKAASLSTLAEADRTLPQFTRRPVVKSRTHRAVLLAWSTSELTTATLDYGKTTAYELGSLAQLEPLVDYEWQLGQLEAGQTYYLRIGIKDLAGNGPVFFPPRADRGRDLGVAKEVAAEEVFTVTALAAPDSRPPAILTGPIAVQTTATTAVIEWTTDESADGEVAYAANGEAQPVVDPEFRRNHQFALTNLAPGQTYECTVASRDVAGNGPARSAPLRFTTAQREDRRAPQIIEGPLSLDVAQTQATIIWTTDEPANTILDYGPTTAYGNHLEQGELAQRHSVALANLAPGTTYHFKVASADLSGNQATTDPQGNTLYSRDHQFTTLRAEDDQLPVLTLTPTVEWTDKTAVVRWSTDELSTSRVDWAWGEGQTNFVEDNEPVRDHSLTMTGLKSRTNYRFQVTSVDAAGNALVWGSLAAAARLAPGAWAAKVLQPPGGAGAFVTDNFPDTYPPVIVDGPHVREKTAQALTVEWETDELADSFVRFGDTEVLDQVVGLAQDERLHRVTLTNLTPGQKYFYLVASTDPSGNGATESSVALTTTAAEADLAPPRFIEGPQVLAKTDREAVMAWRTDEAAAAQVDYWIPGGEVLTRRVAERQAEQQLTLTNLSPDTEYLVRVFATDASQNEARGPVDLRLRTDRLPDLKPPQILSGPEVNSLTEQSAVIEWTTDELANAFADYDITPYLGLIAGDPVYATRHRLVLTGLESGKRHYFKVGSADRAGNGPAESEVFSFTTLGEADRIPPAVPHGLQVQPGTRVNRLVWEANAEPDLGGYNLYRAQEGEFTPIATHVEGTSYLDEGLEDGQTYRYRLTAVDQQANESEPGQIAQGTPGATGRAPRILGLEQGASPALPVLVIQGDDADGLTYIVQVSTGPDFGDVVDRGGGIFPGRGGLTRWRVGRPLELERSYWWRARAVDGVLEGPWSAPAHLRPAEAGPPSLSEDFDGDGGVSFGDFFLFADGFGSSDPLLDLDQGFDPRFDLDQDGVVGFGDFFLFADHFGKVAVASP